MPFEPGRRKTGGRKKGVVNVDNRDIKQAFQNLIELNLDNMTTWLKLVAETNPQKALEIVLDMSERFVPKLARTELVGDSSKPIPVQFYLPKRNVDSVPKTGDSSD